MSELVEQEGLTLVLSPPQLAAALAGASLEEPTLANRGWGVAGALFGTLELLGAGALLLAPDPTTLTKVGGGALGVHGMDTFQAGARQAWSGLQTDTLTSDGTTAVMATLGVDRGTAERIGDGVDLAVPLALAGVLAAVRIASVRAGRISLAAHEAQGGHTIARHVGRTEAELRARLAAQKGIPAASTFESLAQAERLVGAGLRANRLSITQWARTAPPGARRAFEWSSATNVGHGVVRATGSFTPMRRIRIVLKKETCQGKLYYVLTAFPIP